jgi:hypothetical protein
VVLIMEIRAEFAADMELAGTGKISPINRSFVRQIDLVATASGRGATRSVAKRKTDRICHNH